MPAVDQLRTYANIIGLPLKVVMSPEEMVVAGGSGFAPTWCFDTVGRASTTRTAWRNGRIRRGDARRDAPGAVLCFKEQVLMRTAEAFAPPTIADSVLETDEAVNFGLIVNVAWRFRAARTTLKCTSRRQEVPTTLNRTRRSVARMILDNRLDTTRLKRTDRAVVESHAGACRRWAREDDCF